MHIQYGVLRTYVLYLGRGDQCGANPRLSKQSRACQECAVEEGRQPGDRNFFPQRRPTTSYRLPSGRQLAAFPSRGNPNVTARQTFSLAQVNRSTGFSQ